MDQLKNLLQTTLNKTFCLSEFRRGQLEAITTLMTQGRVLCILPTGYGKSLLYQLPACLLDGLTLVISPLLALMRDQIDHLNRRFNIPAMAINSDQTEEENAQVREAAMKGEIKILFVAPEQLDHVDRFQFLLHLNIRLVVVDEAHCISTWGHDFRPSYRQILHFLHAIQEKSKEIKVLGLTATANHHVEEDIQKQLFFAGKKGVVLRQGMERPNISLSVIEAKGVAAKLAICEELLGKLEGCGLVYCATRENTELVAEYLQMRGVNVAAYHAGHEGATKKVLQQEFIKDKYKALVATNALGMGIDKGNLRFIIHLDFPGSITAYYQEVGRCGRDGLPAEGIMLYDPADSVIHNYFIHSALPLPEDFQQIIKAVADAKEPPGLVSIKTLTGLHPTRVTTVVAELVEQGFLEKYSVSGKQVYRKLSKEGEPDLSRYKTQQAVKIQELRQIIHYGSQSEQCRMSILRQSLGDDSPAPCGRCDCCSKRSIILKTAVQGGEVMQGFELEPFAVVGDHSQMVKAPTTASGCELKDCVNSPSSTAAFRIMKPSETKLSSVISWIDKRPLVIAPMVREKVSEGLSILDSKMRSPLFIRFMRERACCPEGSLGMDEELVELVKQCLKRFIEKEKIEGIVFIPSRTWQARDKVAEFLGDSVGIPVFKDLLEWSEIPPKRQGELLNNDQRRDNVHSRMLGVKKGIQVKGALLLFDDYIGSGSTIKEAARALRAAGIDNKIIPLTIAALKWHLGQPGFV